MGNPQAGWYPDPLGDTTKLRYWDGRQWTDSYAAVEPEPSPARPASDRDPFAAAATPQPMNDYQAPGSAQQDGSYWNQAAPAASAPASDSAVPSVSYPVSQRDRTLRTVAFVFDIVGALYMLSVAFPVSVITLAWSIPLTLRCWNIRQGAKPNTIAVGVLTLLFLNIVSGVLLLVSHKDNR